MDTSSDGSGRGSSGVPGQGSSGGSGLGSAVVPAWAGALAGLCAALVALGIAQLVAGFTAPAAFPVIAVGDALVDGAPAPVKDWAIRTFGENDKPVLVAGVFVVLLAVAAGLGILARRKLWYGGAGLALLGLAGGAAVLTRPDAGQFDVLPTLVGLLAGYWTLKWLLGRATTTTTTAVESAEQPPVQWAPGMELSFDRRRLFTGAGGAAVVAGAGAALGRAWSTGDGVESARRSLTLPAAASPAGPLPAGVDLKLPGLTPFVTPNQDFYRVDTALIVPRVDPAEWRLRIHGLVDRPIELTYDDLLKRPLTEADITLTCVSNEVGGPYAGNARWLGVPMADLLRQAGVAAGADMLLSTSQDGWTCGTLLDVVLDGRDALFAVAMNGEVLPVTHGFPVRQVVPGLYGYVSATKWVVDVKVTRFDRDEAYWTPRGWSARGPIKTQSRIDLPRDGAQLPKGRTKIAGVAWAQHKGVEAVEVRIGGGPWQQARLAATPGPDTWRQWELDWDAVAGTHTIEVRATDATGYTQTPQRADPAPDGAAGWHAVRVSVPA
ncbi:molybdopterin-dependent oxidoreductase [Nonomuraea sp. NPDC050310]|uniref:molybdopterin-dependent oxidoreductase n=1 Tax=Nonomuraea sp. NPDC050310 TaxID=3154935 RepID=UPI0033C0704A